MSISFDFSVFGGEFIGISVIVNALLVGVLTCLCASVLGVNLVLKRYSMIGDGLSHVGFLATAIAALIGVTGDGIMYITFPVVIAAAFFLMWLNDSGKLKGDAATALVSVGTVAVGYIIYELAETGTADICSSLFGTSIFTLKMTDTAMSIALSAAVILIYILFYNKIFAVTFDETFAKASGINTARLNLLLSLLTAVTVVVGMKLIGSIMISAVIVIPAVSAMKLFNNFRKVVINSAVISAVCFLLGFFFAVTFVIEKADGGTLMLPVGATIVCFNVLFLLTASIIGAVGKRKKEKP